MGEGVRVRVRVRILGHPYFSGQTLDVVGGVAGWEEKNYENQ